MTHLAFVFPGQGSQSVGMLLGAADHFNEIKSTFAEASSVVGYDLWQLASEGPAEQQAMTEKTQPLLLTASVALWRVWQARDGATPAVMAGHSLGEWSALVCSGVVDFDDALTLVQARGRFMQNAVPVGQGGMAAILGLPDEKINTICQELSQDDAQVLAVNFNSPGQVVIAGHATAVTAAIEQCKAAGAKRALALPVSAPFHTPLMKPAAEQLASLIDDTQFNAPIIPVVHNVNASTCHDPEHIKRLLIEQVYEPVRWVECVQALSQFDVSDVIECGPGKVLTGLIKRIDKTLVGQSIDTPESMQRALEAYQVEAL